MVVQLNNDVLEIIFNYLDFKSLCAAEMTCKLWKEVVNERRLYWQLSKRLSAQMVPKFVNFPSGSNSEPRNSKKRKFECPPERRKLLKFAPVKKYGKNKNSRHST